MLGFRIDVGFGGGMARKVPRFYLVLLIFAAWLDPLVAVTVYVNPDSGSDFNNGQSSEEPLRTLTFALTTVPSGSTIRLSEGVFSPDSGESFTIFVPRAVSIIGAGPDKTFLHNPTALDTINFEAGTGENSIQDMSIVGGFSGLTFAPSFYFNATYHAKNLIIQRVLRTGILVRMKNTFIEDCLLTQNRHVGIEYIPESTGTLKIDRCAAIGNLINGFSGGTFGPEGTIELKSNLIVGHTQFGVLAAGGVGGTISNLTVSRNGLPGIRLSDAHPSQIVNCILHENELRPVESSGSNPPEVVANLFYGPGAVADMDNLVGDPMFVGTEFGAATSGSITSIEYRPDDFQTVVTDASAEWAEGQWAGAVLFPNIDNNTFAHSIVDNTGTTLIVWGDVTDNEFAGANISDRYEIIDYHLQENSPGIDAGTSALVEVGDYDLEGRFRIASSEVDTGAYEFESIFPTPTPTPTPTSTQTPTSTRTPTFTRTSTHTRTPTFTPSQSRTNTQTATPSLTPFGTSTATATATHTPTGTATPTPTLTHTPTLSHSPSPTATTDFDVAPEIPDHRVDALDLLYFLKAPASATQSERLFFDFSRFWMTTSGVEP